jgi:hypothetical protein
MKLRIISPLVVGMAMAALPAAAQAAPMTVAQWPLTNVTKATDMTGNGHNGMASPTVTFTSDGAVFDGSSTRITVPYSAALSPGAADVTAQVEVRTTAMPGTGSLDFDLIRSSPTGKMYKVELFPHGGKAQAQCIFHGSLNGTATRITLHAGPSLNDGLWHTITCTKTPNQVTLTIATNGVVIGTWTAPIQIGTITNRKNSVFALGYKPVPGGTDGDFYNGLMRNASVAIG